MQQYTDDATEWNTEPCALGSKHERHIETEEGKAEVYEQLAGLRVTQFPMIKES